MKFLSAVLIFSVIGNIGARHPDIDINRVIRLPNKAPVLSSYESSQQPVRRNSDLIRRTNDYDDHSSWLEHPQAPLPNVHDAPPADAATPGQIYQPREDPGLYYQSDAYLKEYGRKNINEVTHIYPGQNVVRADETMEQFSRIRSTENNRVASEVSSICVKCPHDRTLVAKASLGRVVMQSPSLKMCSGLKAPRNIKFIHMYGPKFGSLLEQGSHTVIGRVMYRNKSLQLCQMQLHVVIQTCATPKYLSAHCSDDKRCKFTCRDTNLELSGPTTLTCGSDMKWEGSLPVCRARTWCQLPVPPEHGRVSCEGAPAGAGAGLAEGSRCRVRCSRGWRSQRTSAVCRRGAWTHALQCQPKRNLQNLTTN